MPKLLLCTAQSWDLVANVSPQKNTVKPLIPAKEEYISSKEVSKLIGMSMYISSCECVCNSIVAAEVWNGSTGSTV